MCGFSKQQYFGSLWPKLQTSICVRGDCRRDDLLNLHVGYLPTVNGIKDSGSFITVSLKEGKTYSKRFLTVTYEECPFNTCLSIRKYLSLQAFNMTSKRSLIRKEKYLAQHVGKYILASIPKKLNTLVLKTLTINYTGRALRIASATILVEEEGDLLNLRQQRE